jgi:hypothetical protein
MELLLVTSDFCLACARARSTLEEAVRLIPGARMTELSVVRSPDEAEALGIHVTPTVIVRKPSGEEVFRAGGVPTMSQVLAAAALALPAPAAS